MSREDDDGVGLGMATLEHETERALLVVIHDRDGEKRWIPLSQIHADSELWGDSKNSAESAITIVWRIYSSSFSQFPQFLHLVPRAPLFIQQSR